MFNILRKIFNFAKRVINRKFRRIKFHIEPFYKVSLSSDTPGITGWTTRPKTSIRAVVANKSFDAVSLARPDVAGAFFIPLPPLTGFTNISIEHRVRDSWIPFVRFERKVHEPFSRMEEVTTLPHPSKNAALVHAFYPEIFTELEQKLKNLSPSPDVYVFIPVNSPMHGAYAAGKIEDFAYKHVIIGESRGRDAGGFLNLLKYIYSTAEKYDALVILQTKKSPQFPDDIGKAWRDMLVTPLIGSQENFLQAMNSLWSDEKINLIGAADFVQEYNPTFLDPLSDRYRHLCRIFGLPARKTDFIAGTMFWIRFGAIKDILAPEKIQMVIDLLEQGTPEPSYAHAWERFIGLVATHSGGKIKGINFPSQFTMVIE